MRTQARQRPVLRKGWTTGACAAAAAKSSYAALVSGRFFDPVSIVLPKGERPSFPLVDRALAPGRAMAAVEKDAGDDPDVTHGAVVRATVEPGLNGAGIVFRAGQGVGTVTKPGLPLAVGEPAINPAPRAFIERMIADLAEELDGPSDLVITIGVDGGEKLAEKTWNPRLGIKGGLSILGTTGVVTPYSCSAWIHSIHRGIDVARAAKLAHVAACTGSTSERAVKALYDLPDHALLDMGDFAGAVFKYLRRHPIRRLTVGGGFGKITKLAQGALDLHSKRSQVDIEFLARLAGEKSGGAEIVQCASANEALETARRSGLPLADRVAERARRVVTAHSRDAFSCEVVVVDRAGTIVGRAPFES